MTNGKVPCKRCYGTGEQYFPVGSGDTLIKQKCPRCVGTGEVVRNLGQNVAQTSGQISEGR